MQEGATWLSQKRGITTDCLSFKLREVVSLVCVEAHLNIVNWNQNFYEDCVPNSPTQPG